MNRVKTYRIKSVSIKIGSCTECPHFRRLRDYSSDSFEVLEKWRCTKANLDIRTGVGWTDKAKYIPNWCPLAKKPRTRPL